jgi:RNA polymerase sporulation-specific sigma factor
MISGLWSLLIISVINGITLLVSYMANNTFPRPLSEEEEAKYISLLLQGDDNARDILAAHNLRLVAHIVKKYDSSYEETDDLISIGTIGLIKGINSFKPDRGTRLATYAARCIENEILMHLRYTKKNRFEVSLYDPIGVDREGNEITLIEILGTHAEVVPEIVELGIEYKLLLEKMNKLERREKEVLVMRFGMDDGIKKTQRDIARKLGISRSYVSRIEKRALTRLIKELKVEGS